MEIGLHEYEEEIAALVDEAKREYLEYGLAHAPPQHVGHSRPF